MSDDNELQHIGTQRHSGRYPWGSGENPEQRHRSFLGSVEDMKKKGLTETQIAEGLGLSTTELRAMRSIAKNSTRKEDARTAQKLKDKGMSNVAIGKQMDIPESSVRAMLNPAQIERNEKLASTANMLRDQVNEKGYLDVGKGVENYLAISPDKLKVAVAMLRDEGYNLYKIDVPQLGTQNFTQMRVLTKPDITFLDTVRNPGRIQSISQHSEDGGKSWTGILPPLAVNPKRVAVRYAEDGGADMDGVIQLRRGVDDISLGKSSYAQVRIQVGKDHYLKGMAMYADDLPDGVDMRFNTNKNNTGNNLDAMKKLARVKDTGEVDYENPFGSIIRQRTTRDKDGNEKVISALNIVGGKEGSGEEGGWDTWASKLSSQFLSKQPAALAKEQLGLRFDTKKAEFDEINALTNPTIKKKLLKAFADDADSSAVHLKAAGLPGTKSKVILPINSLKDDEIYAPTYRDGTRVVLVRHPHGGIFEIPELRVNNKNREAKGVMQNAIDAVGINAKVAERLSGADFDGDTVLVIPNDHGRVKTSPALVQLKNFNPKETYKAYEGMPAMSPKTKQLEMGKISNLITDMTIRGANNAELARAVKHSMVVIDAEKHNLDYKKSAKDNSISELKDRYQGVKADGTVSKGTKGATTLISRASSEINVPLRKARAAAEGGPIDAVTGKKMYTPTGDSYTVPAHTKTLKSGKVVNVPEKTVVKTFKSKQMAETDDAFTLSSGRPIESVYASYANKMKALANDARKADIASKDLPYSPSAKVIYDPQVKTLNAKLNLALRNAPLERRAQVLAASMVRAKKESNPDMEKPEIKKIEALALKEARNRTGAEKSKVVITKDEWEAVQAGAISPHKLNQILNNADLEQVKALATPRVATVMNTALQARAKSMLAGGYTQAEVAEALGVNPSTLSSSLLSE